MLSKRSMPLCMANMHNKLTETSHLKHTARNQLGLFLKGIGLTVEESMAFWRSEFTKKMPADKWQKEYAYGIRYNYGLEGKRTDWSPHSCMKVISAPGATSKRCNLPAEHGWILLDIRRGRSILGSARHISAHMRVSERMA